MKPGSSRSPKVVHQDRDVLAFHKPAGWHTYGESPGVKETEEERRGEKLYPVHRLDRDTEGLLLFARNPKAAAKLGEAFQRKRVKKTYFAAAWGKPPLEKGSIKLPLKKKSNAPEEPAWTDYRVLRTLRKDGCEVTLFELSPRSGKFHQLRKHLRSIECPILGDPLYLPRPKHEEVERVFGKLPLCLCADRLEFAHPATGKTLSLSVKPSFASFFQRG